MPDELPHEAWLRECFAIDGTVAACALPAADRAPASTPELLVRPVHLHLALDHLVLAPPERLGLGHGEAVELADSANAVLADEGLRLRVLDPAAWRLEAADTQRPSADLAGLAQLLARSARMAAGRNVDAYLPSGAAARRWRQLANLVQMIWFEHPLNLAREAAGQLVVNGLWLEGRAGRPAARPFERVLTTDEALAGAGALLLAPDFWRHPVDEGDTQGWMQAWHVFARWFEMLMATGPRWAAGAMRLVFTGERGTIELLGLPTDRWKPWRRLALATLLEADG